MSINSPVVWKYSPANPNYYYNASINQDGSIVSGTINYDDCLHAITFISTVDATGLVFTITGSSELSIGNITETINGVPPNISVVTNNFFSQVYDISVTGTNGNSFDLQIGVSDNAQTPWIPLNPDATSSLSAFIAVGVYNAGTGDTYSLTANGTVENAYLYYPVSYFSIPNIVINQNTLITYTNYWNIVLGRFVKVCIGSGTNTNLRITTLTNW